MKVRREYKALLDSGDLLSIFPQLSGKWAKDKEAFTESWAKNKEAINEIDVNFEEDE